MKVQKHPPPAARALVAAFCCLLVFLSAGCAVPGKGKDFDLLRQATKEGDELPGGTASFHVLAGELAAKRGHTAEAAAHYLRAMQITADSEIAARATRLSLIAGEQALALQASQQWVELEPANSAAHEIAARLSLRAGDAQGALRHARALIELHPNGVDDGLRAAAIVLASEEDAADLSVSTMQALVSEYPDQPSAHYAMGLLALRLDRLELASDSIDQALALRPQWAEANLLLAGIQVRRGDYESADETMRRVLSREPSNVDIRIRYARMLLEADRTDLAARQYELVLQQEPENAEALYSLGLIGLDLEDPDTAHEYFLRLFRSGQREADAAYYLGRIEELRDNYEAALQWYGRVTSGAQALDATLRRAYMMYRLDRLDEAREYLQQLREQNPRIALRFYLVEGDLLFDAGLYPEALELYDQALQDYPRDADLLYGRALVSEKMGRVDLAEQDLRRILEDNPDDARALNALGYILTNHSTRYREARRYIERALEMTPQDPAVMDSMGWVLFRQGEYAAALEYLEQAFERIKDPEIAAHLGEVYWTLGRYDDARAAWKAGLDEQVDHEVLLETIQRLEQ